MSAPSYPAPHQFPPQGYFPPPPAPKNGFGITALVLALIGLMFSLVPFTGFLAVILGGLAILFGLLGFARARRTLATNKIMSLIGTGLGLLAMTVGIIGMVILFRATDEFVNDLEAIGTPTALEQPADVAAPDDAAPASNMSPAGGSYSWEGGLTVEVSAPSPVDFSELACCSASGDGVAFDVRIVNNTDEVVSPYTLMTSLAANGQPAVEVFDSENGFDGMPANSIPPGAELTFPVAYDATAGELLLEVSGFNYESAFFTATL